ncbi:MULTISPECIES: GIY-YIG nuclease family protein [Legionella]|uniref:Excinuclease ABC C subunit domain-containing protein n=2 Tax=Legionella maceachernii TaxID=466 RepID=A0A0W0WCE1_9GAMM|nr:GIY-YIG nuclease family protein [Legionella maceachernii]KTD30012.1 Excinuclease ABC C subunit domain-containing protein [Legionella maceachernii]SKA30384.1 putative endonuclease [Legionella maceachernii]SUP01779.1 GIY-YIG nuclease superfamily protein [Legionella maceachernii]
MPSLWIRGKVQLHARKSHEGILHLSINKHKNVLYTGITNNLIRRVYEHKHKLQQGFTQKYNVDRLVYYEIYSGIEEAITREKQIKGWARHKKEALINTINPLWVDLYESLW